MQFNEAYVEFSKLWESPIRFYHTKENHLDKILPECDTVELKYFALFHDIIYNPYSSTNEEDSVLLFKDNINKFDDLSDPALVVEMIMATKHHNKTDNVEVNKAVALDMSILESEYNELLEYEKLIFKEFQKTNINVYIQKRIEFLTKYENIGAVKYLIQYLRSKKFTIGLYAGSFDPFHVGHLDILKKSEAIFDKVVVVRAVNPDKPEHKYPMPKTVPNEVIEHTGLITDLFFNDHKYTLIRGIRNEYDIASEMNYMAWVQEIKTDVPFVHIFCDQENIKVSSSALKSYSKIQGFNVDKWLVE